MYANRKIIVYDHFFNFQIGKPIINNISLLDQCFFEKNKRI